MARVLLSHASEDRLRARRLAEGLRRVGHSPWLIEDELRVGRSVLEVVEDGLHSSDFVVACLSQHALQSGWMKAELEFILGRLPRDGASRVFQVRFEEVELPGALRAWQSMDVFEEQWDEGVAQLAAALQRAQDSQPQPRQVAKEDAESDGKERLSRCSPAALQLMKAAIVFAPGPIPVDWLLSTAGIEETGPKAEAALSELDFLGLIRFGSQRREVTPLPPALIPLKEETEPSTLEFLRTAALTAMVKWALSLNEPLRPEVSADFESRRPQIEAILRTTDPSTQPILWSGLALTLGDVLRLRGEDPLGREFLERALAVSERNPALSFITLAALLSLGRLSKSQGAFASARTYFERALAMTQAPPEGQGAGVRSEILAELARLFLLRDPIAAKQAAKLALELAESDPEVTNLIRAHRLSVLALCTRDVDGAASARSVFEQALLVLEQAGQGDTPVAAEVLAGLASVLLQLGELNAAGTALERALSIEQRNLGPTHPDVALRLSNLAEVRGAEGRLAEARELFEQARSLLESRYGPEHRDLGPLLNNLGLTLYRMGRRQEAHACYERAVRILEHVHGPDHPYVASSRAGLFLTMEPGSGEFETGVEHVLSTGLTLYNPKPEPGAEQLRRALVFVRSRQAAPAEVSNALSEALHAADEGGSIPNAARAALLLGAFLGSQGAWESAQEYIERALRLARQLEDGALVAEAYRLLADANLHGSYYEDARLNYAEAIRRYEALGFKHKAARARLLLLTMLIQLGRSQELEPLIVPLRQALQERAFRDAQERADAEQALHLAEVLRGPPSKGEMP